MPAKNPAADFAGHWKAGRGAFFFVWILFALTTRGVTMMQSARGLWSAFRSRYLGRNVE